MLVNQEELEVVQTIWYDHFRDKLPRSQFARWLRMYSIDIIHEGIQAAHHKVIRGNKAGDRMPLEGTIRYASAVMRNIKTDRELDADNG